MTIRFVLDETSIRLDGLSAAAGIEVLELFLDRIDDAILAERAVFYSSDFFETALLGERCFWDLCDPDSPIELPKEVQERAAAAFGTLACWDETEEWPVNFGVEVDGQPVRHIPSVAWAHLNNANPQAEIVACISSATAGYTGIHNVMANGAERQVWFLETARDTELFYRWICSEHSRSPADIALYAEHSFKQLKFVEHCLHGITAMTGQFRDLAPVIARHLGLLSDEGQRIFSGPWQQVPAEFGSLGIEISDENGNTKQNGNARRERRIIVDGAERWFWWHTKLQPHQNRIHICPDDAPAGGAIIVGIFCRHLTT
ncbi:hypothetical protein GR158_18700 [Shinella sp. AETb1-6]|uniref:hypothetical protein n=1 Tax=Shinella sp. AETb1-6 TaxID=2692210 RepID=UPI001367D5FA|nr:hypothetical protein [Shinella sp. AETb1-6]MXN53143.1 hypothetical protein [Shinella sp. AETb1-6]